jgi:ribosomal protein L37AE/L43A
MKAGEKIVIDDITYIYEEFYQRLQALDGEKTNKEIACPKCKNTEFTISYGIYECIANCKCGHSMTVYSG